MDHEVTDSMFAQSQNSDLQAQVNALTERVAKLEAKLDDYDVRQQLIDLYEVFTDADDLDTAQLIQILHNLFGATKSIDTIASERFWNS